MIRLIKTTTFAFFLSFLVGSLLQAQTNPQIRDLFASVAIIKDSLNEHAQIRITFLVNRPEQAARVEFKIGKNVDTQEVFFGTALIEMRGDQIYTVFNGKSFRVLGDKVIIYLDGNQAMFIDASYATIRVQANDGKLSDRAFTFVRNFLPKKTNVHD